MLLIAAVENTSRRIAFGPHFFRNGMELVPFAGLSYFIGSLKKVQAGTHPITSACQKKNIIYLNIHQDREIVIKNLI